MYEVIFYRDKNGKSDIVELLDELGKKENKDGRINRNKILSYMGALQQYGTRIGSPIVKHIGGDLWELRPLSNRILFFYWKDNKFVMLHHFVKKTNKTPLLEIEVARSRLKDFVERYGD